MSQLEYEDLGYTKYASYLTKERVAKLNEVVDKLEATLPISDEVFDESKTGKIKQIQYLHNKDKIFQELLEDLKIIGKDLIGHENFTVLNMQLFEKHPDISKPTRSHQDNAYFQLTPTTALTIWIALDDIDEENGCIYYAPESHKRPTHRHSRYHKDTTFRIRSGVPGLSLCLHEHPEETDTREETKAGDILVHNCNTIHRAGKNNSKNRRRRAIGVVFIPNECTKDPRLVKYHKERLEEDIALQEIKDPKLYKQMKEQLKDHLEQLDHSKHIINH
jgi:phytanoyl-CoA hydroxylase